MTFGPRSHSSPTSPAGCSAPVAGSTTIASMFGSSGPTVETSTSTPSGAKWVPGLVSVRP